MSFDHVAGGAVISERFTDKIIKKFEWRFIQSQLSSDDYF
jgi:hypothetical protein